MECFPPNQNSVCGFPYCGYWCYLFHREQGMTRSPWTWRLRRQYNDWAWEVRLWEYVEQHKYDDTNRPLCFYPIHGVWCKFLLHRKYRVAPAPSRYFNSEDEPQGFGTCCLEINRATATEMDCVNAIYGPGTLRVQKLRTHETELHLKLPTSEDLAFLIIISSDYPNTIPAIRRINGCLLESTDRRRQNIYLILFESLQKTFVTGEVCVFSMLDDALPKISCLRDCCFDSRLAELRGLSVKLRDLWWTAKDIIKMSDANILTECVICCDTQYAFEMIWTPCKHYYCIDCFEAGWEITREDAEPYACCQREIPYSTIRTCIDVSPETEKRYLRLLTERSTPNPFYCGRFQCGKLIGSMSLWDLNRGRAKRRGVFCPHCKESTCVKCRLQAHPGRCIPLNAGLEPFFRSGSMRSCPTCGQGIEKNGGCRHMVCITCKSHWWWLKDGTLGAYEKYQHLPHLPEGHEREGEYAAGVYVI